MSSSFGSFGSTSSSPLTSPTTSHSSVSDAFSSNDMTDLMTFDSSMGTIVITGGAGFIGFHTTHALLRRPRSSGTRIVVIDEMNDYYDPKLKEQNIQDLQTVAHEHHREFEFYQRDICDRNGLEQIFQTCEEKNAPVHSIIHLAARAGVRPSIQDPHIYLQSNIVGTTVLLELAKQYHVSRFVYASSSSVYGGSPNECFRESDIVDFPVSPYAATKKTCELLAYTYYHLYGPEKSTETSTSISISTSDSTSTSATTFESMIGLRFFTVYGPRGRPDMAPYKFVHRMFTEQIIDQYGDGSSSRDYTYIDDIVDGVLRSLEYGRGYQIYNLGNGSPVYLKDFISTIEILLEKKAKIQLLPMQPGDVLRTCADISKAKRDLGYAPQTSIQQGLAHTIQWYLSIAQTKPKLKPKPKTID